MSRACPGDEVYFHHKGEPKVGKVLCAGKHGCTVDHDGTQHKLKWEHLAGHKSRVQQTYTVEHHGEDGMIVKNQHGKRSFMRIPPEARAEQLELQPQIRAAKANRKNSPFIPAS
jgi:hypothetical protein